MLRKLVSDTRKATGVAAAVALSSVALITVLNRLVPTAEGLIGHDFSYFLPYLLSGVQWVQINGWGAVPHFTANFCGGIPWLANPQSMFYSLPQLVTVFTGPVAAVKLTSFFFATLGAAATYALLRQSFGTSWQAATLGFALFQLNGFLLFRTAIGHLTYQVFGLVPVLAWCILSFSAVDSTNHGRLLRRLSCAVIVSGSVLAVMVYGGAVNYVIPAVLTVAAVVLLHQLQGGWRWAPWCTLAGGCVWSISLSAVKLVPAFVFASAYPRPYLHRYLFEDPLRFAKTLVKSLFFPELLPSSTALRDGVSTLGMHEFEFGISVVPALILAAAFLLAAKQIGRPRHPFILFGLLLLTVLPILVTVGSTEWGQLLMRVPIINNNTTLTRWYSIYMLPLILVAALAFSWLLRNSALADVALAGCVAVAAAQLWTRDLSYYTTSRSWPLYDPALVVAETTRVASGVAPVPMTYIGHPFNSEDWRDRTRRNDSFLHGHSALPCYEPIFGYSLELFPAKKLRTGSIVEGDGSINMADPRCYLQSRNATCAPGRLFRREELADVLKFASHQPLHWQKPIWQRIADIATLASLVINTLFFCVVVLVGMLRVIRAPRRPGVS